MNTLRWFADDRATVEVAAKANQSPLRIGNAKNKIAITAFIVDVYGEVRQ
jgi:hypothetical protein